MIPRPLPSFLFSLLAILGCTRAAADAPVIGDGLQTGPLPVASREAMLANKLAPFINADPAWYVWCGSVIRDDKDGRYHMFSSRWPKVQQDGNRGMRGWLYVSQIDHFTSAKPEGPYQLQDNVLKSFDPPRPDRWDAENAHNPCITRMQDPATGKMRYYLYYVATKDDDRMSKGEGIEKPFANDWWDRIINQRIGVAVADSLDGPWTRHPEPVLTPPAGPLHHYLTNPGVVQLPDGKFLMCLKGRSEGPGYGSMIHGWALADRPEGPFVVQDTLLFPKSVLAEDPCVWVHQGYIYAAVKDWHGTLSGIPGIARVRAKLSPAGGVPDGGLAWEIPADAHLASRSVAWQDGTSTDLDAIERPCVLLDAQGEPSHLFTAASIEDPFASREHLPFNLCQPLLRGDPAALHAKLALRKAEQQVKSAKAAVASQQRRVDQAATEFEKGKNGPDAAKLEASLKEAQRRLDHCGEQTRKAEAALKSLRAPKP